MQHEVQLERKDRESTEEIFLTTQYLLQTVRIIVVRLTLSRSRQVNPGGTCLIIAQEDCRSGCMCETQQLRKECSQWMASLYRLSAPTAPPAATCWSCRCRSRRTGCSVCPEPSTESHCGCSSRSKGCRALKTSERAMPQSGEGMSSFSVNVLPH